MILSPGVKTILCFSGDVSSHLSPQVFHFNPAQSVRTNQSAPFVTAAAELSKCHMTKSQSEGSSGSGLSGSDLRSVAGPARRRPEYTRSTRVLFCRTTDPGHHPSAFLWVVVPLSWGPGLDQVQVLLQDPSRLVLLD